MAVPNIPQSGNQTPEQALVGAGCPQDVAQQIVARCGTQTRATGTGITGLGGLGVMFWIQMAEEFGPVVWQLVQRILTQIPAPTPAQPGINP